MAFCLSHLSLASVPKNIDDSSNNLKILKSSVEELDSKSDFYMAASHLINFPGEETVNGLIGFLQISSQDSSVLLAQAQAGGTTHNQLDTNIFTSSVWLLGLHVRNRLLWNLRERPLWVPGWPLKLVPR